jgi:hypothetical protein
LHETKLKEMGYRRGILCSALSESATKGVQAIPAASFDTTALAPVQESTNLAATAAAADDDDEPMAGLETPIQSEVVYEADEITQYLAKCQPPSLY